MKLVAAVITKNEVRRYLRTTIASLTTFCDDVRVLDDFSDDGTYEWLLQEPGVSVLTNSGPTFDAHEGKARNALLQWVREAEPTHVLAVDADELISDGRTLRRLLESRPEEHVWTLEMAEVWAADERRLWIRMDGLWRPRMVPVLWRAGEGAGWWSVRDQELACGREPTAISSYRRIQQSGVSIFHFGWTNVSERQRRFDRYMAIDGGNFHASRHLQSIMWPQEKVRMAPRGWPVCDQAEILEAVREERG